MEGLISTGLPHLVLKRVESHIAIFWSTPLKIIYSHPAVLSIHLHRTGSEGLQVLSTVYSLQYTVCTIQCTL